MQPRTPRAPSDRGRYPEEAEDRDLEPCQTPSDDSDCDEPDGIPFAFSAPTQEPITIRTRTPVASVNGSLCGDDPYVDSPGAAMDIDLVRISCPVLGHILTYMREQPPSLFGSPAASSLHQWRYTPPPTASSAVRTSKRKCRLLYPSARRSRLLMHECGADDDRFDPYPTSSKRRAVSPSVSYLRENHTPLSPIYIPRSGSSSRAPIPVPITSSAAGSVASSPISHSGTLPFASPTMRATMGLGSPITRPMRMSRRIDGEDREVDGTGEAVNGLSLV